MTPHTDDPLNPRQALSLVFLVLLIGVCTASGAALEIAVRHSFNGDPILLDSLRYENAAGETLSFTRLSYLLSGFAI